MQFNFSDYQTSADIIRAQLGQVPETAVVLGSGLGGLPSFMKIKAEIPYEKIPFFPKPAVASHAGVIYCGTLAGKEILALAGRSHCYEGKSMQEVSFYVRALKLAGVHTLLLTNAAGAVNPAFAPGEFMCITDHIKLCGGSPVNGEAEGPFGPRFFDMSQAYSPVWRKKALQAAQKLQMTLHTGVYAFMPGPQYETPAEIRMLSALGADAVGMSTVPEVITAAQCGMEVLAISFLSNMAAGLSRQQLTHEEVTQAAGSVSTLFVRLLQEILTAAG